jgi:hypothetical protein
MGNKSLHRIGAKTFGKIKAIFLTVDNGMA